MNILLVDDDQLILQELQSGIDWVSLGIERIFVASGMKEAQRIIQTVPIHAMLCDIEMPGGSGLELLEWVRQNGYEIQCIFLTNYADFTYAKQAIHLESMEYLLKPIDRKKVTGVIGHALKKAVQNEKDGKAKNYWLDSEKETKELLWQRYFLSDGKKKETGIRYLGYDQQDFFILATLKAAISSVEMLWGEDMFEFVLKNVLYELIDTVYLKAESVFPMSENIWVIVCRFSRDIAPDSGSLEEVMQLVSENCEKKLHFEATIAVGHVCIEEELRDQLESMKGMMENTLNSKGHILRMDDYRPSTYIYMTPDISIWESLLKTGNKKELTNSVNEYVYEKAKRDFSQKDLRAFRQDLTQMIYSFLHESGIQAHRLFAEKQAERYYQRACNSAQDMCLYCSFLIDKVIEYKKFTDQEGSLMETILQYVDGHFCEEISRNDLVNLVYISPDYCSRLFKKETGRTLAQYVLEKRVEKAKKLLVCEIPIKTVALQVGYSNFSYFSKGFKEITGITPMEFRERSRDQAGNEGRIE